MPRTSLLISAQVNINSQYHSDCEGYWAPHIMRQVLDNRYVEPNDLHALLKRLFGAGNYEVDVGEVIFLHAYYTPVRSNVHAKWRLLSGKKA